MFHDLPAVKRPFISKYAAIAIILIISIGVYLNTLSNEFVYDDKAQIIGNPWIKDVRFIPKIFTSDMWGFEDGSNYYRPMVHVFYMADYHIFGLKPWGFRLSFMLLHAMDSVLVFLIASKLVNDLKSIPRESVRWSALIAAILFATHPIHTEALGWGGGEPLFAFFYLSSFYLYMKTDGIWGWRFILSLFFFFLSALSKETAFTLPILLIAYDYSLLSTLPLRERVRACPRGIYRGLRGIFDLKRYFPYLIAAGTYFIIRLYVIGGIAPVKRHIELSAYEYFINIFPLFAQYLEKLILPINISVYYAFHPIHSVIEWKGMLSIILTLLFICVTYLLRKNRIVIFSLSWMIIPLLPALYIPALAGNTFAERYLYLPSVGFVILISMAMERIYELKIREKAACIAMISMIIVITGLYSLGTIKRNYIYRDNYTLWINAVEKMPDGYEPHNNLGLAYYDKGLLDKAVEHYQTAIRLQSDYAEAYNNLGIAYQDKGLLDQAIEYYQTALRLSPGSLKMYYNLGAAYYNKGLLDKAIEHYKIAIKLKPDLPEAYYNLGIAYHDKGLSDKTIEYFQTAIRLRPDYSEAYNNLGMVYHEKGLPDKAIEYFQTAMRLRPDNPAPHYNMGNAYKLKGLKDEARKEFETVLKLKPGDADARRAIELLDRESQTFK